MSRESSLRREAHVDTCDPLVVAIGGTGASRARVQEYYGHLVGRSARDVDPSEKLFSLTGGGMGPLQNTYDRLRDHIAALRARYVGRKVVALGHSQGGVHAARLGVDGLADAVIAMAAPIRGGVTHGLPGLAGDYGAAKALERDLEPTSEFMRSLRASMANEWSEEVPLHVVAATQDLIVPRESQFGARLPDGRRPQEHIVVPTALSMMGGFAVMLATGAPSSTSHLRSDFPVDHFTIPHATGLPRFVDTVVAKVSPGM